MQAFVNNFYMDKSICECLRISKILFRKHIRLLVMISLLTSGIVFSAQANAIAISHNGATITQSNNNFTFANSIWKNSDDDVSTFNGVNESNYLLIDDIYVAGTLSITTSLSSGQSVALYKLVETGVPNSYVTELVSKVDGPYLSLMYYISQPGSYMVEAMFNGAATPRVTIDFFPNGDGASCTHLAPLSGLSCEESWLPAHYRRDVRPWVQSRIDEIRYRMGQVSYAKRLADQKMESIDVAFDAAMMGISCSNSTSTPTSCASNIAAFIGERGGDWADDTLTDAGHENIGFALDAITEHGILFAQVAQCYLESNAKLAGGVPLTNDDIVGCGTSFASLVETLGFDIVSIIGNSVGLRDLSELEERFNETRIARAMLESLIRDNYGRWDGLVVNAGFASGSNPSMNLIIDGFANKLGYQNLPLLENQYVRSRVQEIFLKGSTGLGDWVSARRMMQNPLDDVDGDGLTNIMDPDPNDQNIPAPDAVISEPDANINSNYNVPVTVGTSISFDGGNSTSDPSRDPLTFQWTLIQKPNGSNAMLTGSAASQRQLVPDVEGSYTVVLTVFDGVNSSSVQKVVTAFQIYNTSPVLLPEQQIVGPISGAADSRRYYYIDVPDNTVTKVIVWMYGSSQGTAGPADIYASYNKNPTVAFTHPYDPTVPVITYQYGAPNDLSREQFDIVNPRVGRYHVLLYGFMGSYSNVNLFYQFERGVVDSDSDGVPDANDAFPNDPAASLDTDGDGYPDAWNSGKSSSQSTTGLRVDAFPNDLAASLDTDGDGYPDTWNLGKSSSQSTTGLRLDAFLNDTAASLDTDGDGYPDSWNAGKTGANSTTGLRLDAAPTLMGNVPDVTSIGVAAAGNGQAIVEFISPVDNGGHPITKYIATSDPLGMTGECLAPCSNVVVSGLVNGQQYSFTVFAINDIGRGEDSVSSNAVVPIISGTVPDAPTLDSISVGDRRVVVNFSAPLSDGGNQILSYIAVSSPGAWSGGCAAPCSSIEVSGLTNGVPYTFVVKAINAVGLSASSNISTPMTPIEQYTVTATTVGGGSVSEATQSVISGEVVSFAVTPDSGYTTDSTVGGTCPSGSWSGVVYTTGAVMADCSVSFTFSPVITQYTVSATAGIGGVVDVASQTVTSGNAASFTLTPDSGYTTDSTVGGTCPGGSWSGTVYTTGTVTADCSVSFTFSPVITQYTVSATAGVGGSIDVASQTVNSGNAASFTLTSDTGYTTDSTVGGTCPVGSWSGTIYTTGAVITDCTVSFSFAIAAGGGLSSLSGWRYQGYNAAATGEDFTTYSVSSGTLFEYWSIPTNGQVTAIRTGNVSGDAGLEAVIASGSEIRIVDQTGMQHVSTITVPQPVGSMILDDIDEDGINEIMVGVNNSSDLNIYIYDGSGVLKQILTSSRGGSDTTMFPVAYLGSGRLVVGYNAGYASDPRGYALFDINQGTNGTELWYYDIGPALTGVSVADIDGNNKLDFVGSVFTPHNGATGTGIAGSGTTTTDGDLYTIVVDEDGTEKLVSMLGSDTVGGANGQGQHVLTDLEGDGTYEIVASVSHYSSYAGDAQIRVLNADGAVRHQVSVGDSTYPEFMVGDLDDDGSKEIVVLRRTDGVLEVYDAQLNLLTSLADAAQRLAALSDVDGDGEKEIVSYANNFVQIYDRGTLALENQYALARNVKSVVVSSLGDSNKAVIIAALDGDGIVSLSIGRRALVNLTINGPSSVFDNSVTEYQAIAEWGDSTFSVVSLSAVWTTDDPYALIDKGNLETMDFSEDRTVMIDVSYSDGVVTKYDGLPVLVMDQGSAHQGSDSGGGGGVFELLSLSLLILLILKIELMRRRVKTSH